MRVSQPEPIQAVAWQYFRDNSVVKIFFLQLYIENKKPFTNINSLLLRRRSMTKQDIINQVSSRASLSRVKAEEAVETVIELIKESLGHGEPVILRRFGTFQVRAKSKRVVRNPKTGEEAEISARKVVRFKSGKFFKQAVDEGEG